MFCHPCLSVCLGWVFSVSSVRLGVSCATHGARNAVGWCHDFSSATTCRTEGPPDAPQNLRVASRGPGWVELMFALAENVANRGARIEAEGAGRLQWNAIAVVEELPLGQSWSLRLQLTPEVVTQVRLWAFNAAGRSLPSDTLDCQPSTRPPMSQVQCVGRDVTSLDVEWFVLFL